MGVQGGEREPLRWWDILLIALALSVLSLLMMMSIHSLIAQLKESQ